MFVVLVMFGLVAVFVTILMQLSRARDLSRQINCSANVRGIHQGFVLSASNGEERYILPSIIDKAGNTIRGDAAAKNTTSAIVSALLYGTYINPEMCVSPAEKSPNIRVMENFEYDAPTGTVNPKLALWDPAFQADFTAKGGGNFSYAHMMPAGERRKLWTNTFNDREAVIGNRGPLISSVSKGASPNVTPTFNTSSYTLRIHGPRASWEGNIAYNDNHVSYEETMHGYFSKDAISYEAADKTIWHDLFHFDEPDDPSGLNNFLGIYTQAGPTPAAFKTIWD
ncbi:MAG: hypothetical protein HEQ23_07315 [Tepidisphaera sp.]